ncbi:hypothetical protein O9992_21195 [Vibrio lentus]|nr:hypothetical protein [Vibrio lentus]
MREPVCGHAGLCGHGIGVLSCIWGHSQWWLRFVDLTSPATDRGGGYTAAGGDTALMATFGFGALILSLVLWGRAQLNRLSVAI